MDLAELIGEDIAEYVTSSNDAVTINIVRSGTTSKEPKISFHPKFTYAIFGDDEIIPGYKKLDINVDFRAHDLLATKIVTGWEKKIEPKDATWAELMDVEPKIMAFLPPKDPSEESLHQAAPNWTPPGSLRHSYTVTNDNTTHSISRYEIWSVSLADPRAKKIAENLKIFAYFFIEGATFSILDEPDWSLQRWKLWLLYRVDESKASGSDYTLGGFATSYRLYVTPDKDASDALAMHNVIPNYTLSESQLSDISNKETLEPTNGTHSTDFVYDTVLSPPSRERIAQFLILPPWQSQSHGSQLYNSIIQIFLDDPVVFEITIEDPNEDFDKLRDYNDLIRLNADPSFTSIRLPDTIPDASLKPDQPVPLDILLPVQADLDIIRHKYKLAPRQFARLLEMHLLSTIPSAHRSAMRIIRKAKAASAEDRHYYFWRLVVKDRLFKRNRDELMQLDEEERRGKVDDLIPGIQSEYEGVLEGVQRRAAIGAAARLANGKGKAVEGETPSRKRKVIVEDDEDEEAGGSKRARV